MTKGVNKLWSQTVHKLATYQNNSAGIGVECPGDGYPLSLASRQVDASLTDLRLVAGRRKY